MCYDDNARPPMPPGGGGAITTEDLVLTASDGNKFGAYLAVPTQPVTSQIIIYPDVRGLHQFYKELANRFAEVGVRAIAIDYFGRTAGLTGRDESFEFMPHVQQMTLDTFFLDVHAAKAYLKDKFGAGMPTFVVGFCMGGSYTLMSGTDKSFGFAGLVPFYAGMTPSFGDRGTVLDNATKVAYPVLGLFGGADQGIPESAVRELDTKLDTAGVPHEVVIYPGAPHSFFDRKAAEFTEASADAWRRILDFVATHKQPA